MVKAARRTPANKKANTNDAESEANTTVESVTAASPAAKKKGAKRVAEVPARPVPSKKSKVAKQLEEEDASSASDDDDDEQEEELLGSEDEELEASDDEEAEEAQEASDSEAEDNQDIAVDVKQKGLSNAVSVFVGNLPSNIKRDKLIKLFAPHAKVKAVRFRRNDGGQLFNVKTATLASVIAFVDVGTEGEAKAAAAALNGVDCAGHVLRVNLQRGAKTAEAMDEKRTIVVGNLCYAVTDELLRETFECCGEIEYVRTLQSAKGCSGLGFVCFAEAASVQMAFELNNGLLLERPVRVSRYAARKKPAEGKPLKKHQTFGAQRRLAAKGKDGDNKKKGAAAAAGGKGSKLGKFKKTGDGEDKKKKKNGFSGAKVSDQNKKGEGKKKRPNRRGPKLLARKIAPREKAAETASA